MNAFGLSDEQRAFASAVSDFCRKECGDRDTWAALTDGGSESHNQQLYEKLAATGYLGVSIPEEYGGSGGGLIEQVLLFEELWKGIAPVHGAGRVSKVFRQVNFRLEKQISRRMRRLRYT